MTENDKHSTHPTRAAAGGLLLWVLWVAVLSPARTPAVTMFAPFVIVPLGLAIAARGHTGPRSLLLGKLAVRAPLLAISSAMSFRFDTGPLAATMTVPWLGFTTALALIGIARLMSRRTLNTPGIGVDAGLIFIVVGAAFLTLSRAGLRPLGFSDRIIELTASHFHFAGFALPIIAGAVSLRLGRGPLVPAAIIIGIPFTAMGITFAGRTEWIAATFMALAGLAAAGTVLQLAPKATGRARIALTIAGLALIGGMALALGWSWSAHYGWGYLDLDGMVATHGVLNGFGFALLGLVGLNAMPDVAAPDQHRVCIHLGRPSEQHLAKLRGEALEHDPTNPAGLLYRPLPDGFETKVWRRPIEHGDFKQASNAIRAWAGHRHAGIARFPDMPPLELGETLALTIPVGPISVSATAQVVELIDELDRFGFAYSTLPHHPEDGEESFVVTRHPNGDLEMIVTAVWRGAAVANHVLPPLTRFLQNQAIGRYLDGTAEFTNDNDLQLQA